MRSMFFVSLLVSLLLNGCVSEIIYDIGDQTFTVIEGVITNSPGESIIRISRVTGYGQSEEKIRGEGVLYKNGSPETNLVLLREGELALPINLKLEEGASYHIEITTEDNQTYASIPQVIQPRFRTDSLSFDFDRRLEGVNSAGAPIYVRYIDIFAHVEFPGGQEDQRFYRWEVDESWAFKEKAVTPADPVATCYLRRGVTENLVTILTNDNLTAGLAKVRIATQPVDESFSEKHYFNAYLHSIDRRAFEFYEQAERLIENSGTLFDEIPAPIKGNMFNPDDEEELVLGYVEFSQVDTARIAINRSQIPFAFFQPCILPNPCPPRNLPPGTPQPPCACLACAAFFGFETLNPPPYWE
jgi:hypothetical protein